MVEIEEVFANLVQAKVEYRVAVTNLTDANTIPTYQVAKYSNHLVTKDADMASLTRMITQFQSDTKNLKSKLSFHTRK